MKPLSISNINKTSPYEVFMASAPNVYRFYTSYGVDIAISFDLDDLLKQTDTYMLSINNVNNHKSPRDLKVRDTIFAITTEFFAKNQAALLYICETGDGMQKTRNRLFHFWFNIYGKNKDFLFLPMIVYDEDDNENYTALIISKDHPRFAEVVLEYTATVNLLNDKPEIL